MDRPEISVRVATAADVEQIVALWKEMMDFNAGYETRFTRAGHGHELFAKHLAEKLLPSELSCVMVAIDAERVLGYVMVHDQPRVPIWKGERRQGFITDMSVARDSRRQGIGTALLGAAEQWCSE